MDCSGGVAADILTDWDRWRRIFVRVLPRDYARVLAAQKSMPEAGLGEAEAEMAAFELNARDAARAGGR